MNSQMNFGCVFADMKATSRTKKIALNVKLKDQNNMKFSLLTGHKKDFGVVIVVQIINLKPLNVKNVELYSQMM